MLTITIEPTLQPTLEQFAQTQQQSIDDLVNQVIRQYLVEGYEKKVYTIDEVATILRVSAETIQQLIQQGELAAIRLGQIYRIPIAVIDNYFTLPAPTKPSAESLGFGMLANDKTMSDSVEYVNQLRATEARTLQEVVSELTITNK